ncbi:RNA polymerase sigma-I factor [Bacillus sp. FJAT-45066]|uniref:RNA polymerase sigma-I factor n=1 Tax=Bacillus sp. FJAT-45066 TaxID=2011010 RepID=UPI000BB6FBAE|nr:RNA polymerase sigma-I factor [Bacillus sp. FJAT-45066]
MNGTKIPKHLKEASNGDELSREKLIRHYKPYILSTVGNLCRRYISWNDEESSIGLLAFNRAIDTFDENGGRTFLNFAYLLMKRDLIDFYRKEKKETHIRLETNNEEEVMANTLDFKKSLDNYQHSLQRTELVEEILELSEKLQEFQINFEELEQFSPRHKRTKKTIFEMANHFFQYPDLVEIFKRKKRFPSSEFISRTNYHIKTVERHRKYLISLIILKLHPEWKQITGFIADFNEGGERG